jgi:hypothetical protein
MGYDFSKSNMALMVGGQLVMIIIAIMVVLFGIQPIHFEYADQMRNMVASVATTSVATNAAKSVATKSAATNAAKSVATKSAATKSATSVATKSV